MGFGVTTVLGRRPIVHADAGRPAQRMTIWYDARDHVGGRIPVRRWNVAEAKAKLSEVLHEAQGAPQVIESRGRQVAVVLSMDDYRHLAELQDRAAPRERLAEFLRFSEALRKEGGATLRPPRRTRRPSPFSKKAEY
jgi:prevent-host-death family protein